MKNVCKYIGVAIFVLGIIGSFIIASKLGNLGYERDWGLTFGCFLGGIFSTVVQSVMFFALSELLEDNEFLSNQINNIKSETNQKENEAVKTEKKEIKDGWICPECGLKNYKYTFTCGCGYSKH